MARNATYWAEATEVLRQLIDRIVLTPDVSALDGLAVELHGDLATILDTSQNRLSGSALI